jgi:acyl transferase domain-containing protein
MTSLGMLSPDGKSHSFDHRANGYARGEGSGIVVLKRLSDAVRDQDTIRAVIRNTVTNSDGRSPSITQPTKWAQAEAIRDTYKQVGIDPRITRYFEAHSTGTPVGDPIEASAIADVFAKLRSPEEPLYVGALKSSIGHLEAAAGIAALIKAILVLESGMIPPNLNFEKVNPRIPAKIWNMEFPTSVTPWPSEGIRRASINAFGYGGSNAHVVLDDAFHYLRIRGITGNHNTAENLQPKPNGTANGGRNGVANGHTIGHTNGHTGGKEIKHLVTHMSKGILDGLSKDPAPSRPRVFVFSAFDEAGLGRLSEAYYQHLLHKNTSGGVEEDGYLDDLCYTLALKRTSFHWRASITASSLSSLLTELQGSPKPIRASAQPRLAFIFTGQGAQWHAMGRELLVYPVFKSSLVAALVYLHELGCSWSLLRESLSCTLIDLITC